MQKHLLLSLCSLVICLSMEAQWSLSGNPDATSTSKLGTTNGIPLRLFTNNLERMRIDAASGKISIGTTAFKGKLTLFNNGSIPASSWVTTANPLFTGFGETTGGNSDFYLLMASNTATSRPNIIGRKARGTLAAPTAVANNDYITSLQASAYDGSAFQNAANVDFFADGLTSPGNVPMRISFTTGSNLSNRKERLKIGSTGDINFNNGQMLLKASNGNVGIGIEDPYYKLHVIGDSSSSPVLMAENKYKGTAHRTAIYGIALNSNGYGVGVSGVGGYLGVDAYGEGGDHKGNVYGVSAFATGTAGVRYGIAGHASGGDYNYGIYGWAFEGKIFNAAGYFEGDVYASSYLTTSDRKFKKDIVPLGKPLSQVMKLKPSTYQFKGDEYKGMGLPDGEQLGFIADEVKQVFPQLVKKAVQPAQYDKKDRNKMISPEVKYEAVNYQGLIPVVIASVQEQQQQIEVQKQTIQNQLEKLDDLTKEVSELKTLVSKLVNGSNEGVSLSSASLESANPNPVMGSTIINYNIPEGSKTAHLLVTDMKGSVIKQIILNSRGASKITLNTTALAAGTYTYSLHVDGSKVDSKQLIVAR